MNFLLAAMEILQFGWRIFPVAAGLKVPAIPKGRGVLDATDDEDTIEAWAQKYPDANVGLACGLVSGILVVDIDAGNSGMASVLGLRAEGLHLPPTVSVRTPNGGWHLYYKFHPGPNNSKSRLGRGIDIRTTGGYVVAPPSQLHGGKSYRWHTAPLGSSLPDLPRWAIDRLKPRQETPFYKPSYDGGEKGDIGGLVYALENAAPGERNSLLHWCGMRAGETVARGEIAEADAVWQLSEAAARIGLDRAEIMKTLGSGIRRGKNRR